MRTWTETHSEGTDVGPVDWSHPWIAECRIPLEMLHAIAEHPEQWTATTDGGWPRVGFHRVITFCMYDGWPYWRPHPALCLYGPLGPAWHDLRSITEVCHA